MRTTSATIYTGSDDQQAEDILFEYEYILIDEVVHVKYLKLKLRLFGTPDDLKQDLSCAIAADLGLIDEILVVIQCEIENADEPTCTLHDLRNYPHDKLTELEILLTTGISEAKRFKLNETVETGESFLKIVGEAKQIAIQRYSDSFVREAMKEFKGIGLS